VTSEQPPLPPATDLSDVTVAPSSASALSTPTVGVTKRGGDKSVAAAAAISDSIITARGAGMSRRDEQQRHSFSNAVSPLHTVESSSGGGGGEEVKGSSSSTAGTPAGGAFSRVPKYRYAEMTNKRRKQLVKPIFSDFNRVVTG
jgi:hypothetical protein